MSIQIFLPNSKSLSQILTIFFLCFASIGCASVEQGRQLTGVKVNTVSNSEQTMHYAFSGNVSNQGVLFIHGTPGGWSAFADYLNDKELQQKFFMVSIDRLNWGKSTSQQEFSFDQQIESIKLVLESFPDKSWVIVGHSLGASMAPKLAVKYPDSVSALILLAGSLVPDLGKPRWYNRFASNLLINWMIPKDLRSANIEIMALESELSILDEEILATQFDSHVVVIQGMKDKLVSPNNAQFVADHWRDNFNNLKIIELQEEGHFLPWRQPGLIVQTLEQLDACLNQSDINAC